MDAMTDLLHPGLVLIFGGLIAATLRGVPRAALVLLAPLAAMVLVWTAPEGVIWRAQFLGHALTPFVMDKLSRLFALIFALMAFGGALFALNRDSQIELPAALVHAGSAVGVTLAGDLLTVFVFWELMAIGSTLVIWSAGTPAAYRASLRYLMFHLLGGVLLMAGIAGHIAKTDSIVFERLAADTPAHWLILAAFLLNAAVPPLHAWLTDAYPEATVTGAVFLSAFTTKAAVYTLLRAYPGTEILIWLGAIMAVYGVVYAVLENDIRRLLAYHIVSQVGYMVAGVGIGTAMALNGTAAHAFTHILYKGLLFMGAGAVIHMTGRNKFTELGGLYRRMPLTFILYMVGGFSISAFPLFSGFVSKSMVISAAAEDHLTWIWLLLTLASAGTFLHTGLKLPYFTFLGNDSGIRTTDPPRNMLVAMVLFAALCIGIGVYPDLLYAALPYPVHYQPYTGAHVVGTLQLLLFTALVFFLLLDWLKPARTVALDVDWLYRRAGPAIVALCTGALSRGLLTFGAEAQDWRALLLRWTLRWHGPDGPLARTLSTGAMALWISALLAAYLVMYYV